MRKVVVEKAARGLVAGAAIVRIELELVSRAVGRLRATSIVRGFADAIVWLLVAVLLLRGGIEGRKMYGACNSVRLIGSCERASIHQNHVQN